MREAGSKECMCGSLCLHHTPPSLFYYWDIQDMLLKDTDSPVPFSDLNHRVSEV